jgi:hypothetical protein
MENKNFKKICPQCNRENVYKNKYAFLKSVKYNKVCGNCSRKNTGIKNKGKERTKEFKSMLSKKMTGHPSIKGNQERANKIKIKLLGRDTSSFHRGETSFIKECITCHKIFKCQLHRKESHHFCCRKCQTEYYFSNKKWHPKFNPIACSLIDEYGSKHNYNFQHALNGGEHKIKTLNFWVDGYDPEKNVVIEYNEKHHNSPIQKEKDKIRREKIINTLKCEFIVLHYNNEIKKYKYEK